MNIIEIFKEWGGFAIALLTCIGSLLGYLRHDRKLKEQEKLFNDLQIKQIENNEAKERMANIKCNIYSHRGNATVKIVNAGSSDAFNVRIESVDRDFLEGIIFRHEEWGPYDIIKSSDSIEEKLMLCEGHAEYLTLRVLWDDNYAKNRRSLLKPQIK